MTGPLEEFSYGTTPYLASEDCTALKTPDAFLADANKIGITNGVHLEWNFGVAARFWRSQRTLKPSVRS